jgi:uncharacterized protein YciI/uncharacterized protein YndB with AHSA1/START domain
MFKFSFSLMLSSLIIFQQSGECMNKSSGIPKIYYALIHQPGPKWQQNVDFREQAGVQKHVEYFSKFFEMGLLKLGGPFLDNSGGMAILAVDSFDEAQKIAQEDPTVQSGLLIASVKEWMLPFDTTNNNTSLNSIVIEHETNVSIGQLWNAWIDKNELMQWLAPKVNVNAEVDGLFELFWDPEHPEINSTLGCKISEIKSQELLSFNWKGPIQYADIMNKKPLPTFVRLSFKSLENKRSLVRLEHGGWEAGSRWQEARAWQEKAWLSAFNQLDHKFSTSGKK